MTIVPNGKLKEPLNIDATCHGFTKWQREKLLIISGRKGFEHFCYPDSPNDPHRPEGPFAVLWYENGRLYVQRLGKKRDLTPPITTNSTQGESNGVQ